VTLDAVAPERARVMTGREQRLDDTLTFGVVTPLIGGARDRFKRQTHRLIAVDRGRLGRAVTLLIGPREHASQRACGAGVSGWCRDVQATVDPGGHTAINWIGK